MIPLYSMTCYWLISVPCGAMAMSAYTAVTDIEMDTGSPLDSTEAVDAGAPTAQRMRSTQTSTLLDVGLTINKYGLPILVGVGIIGNIISLILMQRKVMRKSSSSVYFSALAVADTLALFRVILFHWLKNHVDVRFVEDSDIACKFKYWVSYFSTDWAAIIVVLLTCERFAVINFPFNGKRWWTRKNAVVMASVSAAIIGLLWAVLVLMWGISLTGPCDDKRYKQFRFEYGRILAIILYSGIPVPLLLVLNIVNIYKLEKTRRTRAQMVNNQITGDASVLSKTSLTAMAVSISYFLLTLPTSIFVHVFDFLNNDTATVSFFVEISTFLRMLNHSINFFLYLLVLPKIRSELNKMFFIFRKLEKKCSVAKSLK